MFTPNIQPFDTADVSGNIILLYCPADNNRVEITTPAYWTANVLDCEPFWQLWVPYPESSPPTHWSPIPELPTVDDPKGWNTGDNIPKDGTTLIVHKIASGRTTVATIIEELSDAQWITMDGEDIPDPENYMWITVPQLKP